MIHVERKFLVKQIVPKFRDVVYHVECLTFLCGIVLFGCRELSASIVNWSILVGRHFLHEGTPDGHVRCVNENMEGLRPIGGLHHQCV